MKCKLAVVLALAACAVAQQSKTRRLTRAERMGVSGARSVRDKVADPESFRVSGVRIVVANKKADGRSADGVYWICIEGRAKNRMGGYISLVGLAMGTDRTPDAMALDVSEADVETSGYHLRCMYPWSEEGTSTLIAAPGADVTDVVKAALRADREKD